MKRIFTKLERKELRRLTGLAYERELIKALELLEKDFGRWRKNEITAFELNNLIHKFHNGISRALWSFYANGHHNMIVAQAIENGVILKSEVKPGTLEKLGVKALPRLVERS